MNRLLNICGMGWDAVPRTRGDEPATRVSITCRMICSPHARG